MKKSPQVEGGKAKSNASILYILPEKKPVYVILYSSFLIRQTENPLHTKADKVPGGSPEKTEAPPPVFSRPFDYHFNIYINVPEKEPEPFTVTITHLLKNKSAE